jgi:hypothetical protein
MNTNVAERQSRSDPDDERPDTSHLDWSKAEIGRGARKPGEKTEICIDGAVAYRLRLIPSNRVLARFDSTLEAWPVIIATVDGGRSPRTLSLDAEFANGTFHLVSAGPRLERWARFNDGGPNPYGDGPVEARRRVAEGAA